MNKVLIVSDSHGLRDELITIRKRHEDVDLALHCGDSELQVDDPSLEGYHVVRGNCDWQGKFPEELVLETGGLTFYFTHGHLLDVKNTLLPLQYRADEKQADIVCFGHSHLAYAEKVAGKLFINPSSIRLPRQFSDPTYVILEWDENTAITVTFYHVNGQVLPAFPYSGQFNLK
jgi:putative phosphoesterase